MVVEKISVNSLKQLSFGVNQMPQDSPMPAMPVEKKRDTSKIVAWSLAGLATAGLAGVLIYNARRGRTGGSANDPLSSLGTYMKKYLNEGLFAESASRIQNGATELEMKVSHDRNDIQLYNRAMNDEFSCHLVKQVPADRTDVPNFEFRSERLDFQLQIFNKDKDASRFDFLLNSEEQLKLSIGVDAWRGNILDCSLQKAGKNYDITANEGHEIVENLDLRRFIDDRNYRNQYVLGLHGIVHEIIMDAKLKNIAQKSGKTVKDITEIYRSDDFRQHILFLEDLSRNHTKFNLFGSPYESGIIPEIRGKDYCDLLEDYITGTFKINKTDAQTQGISHLPAEKALYEYSVRNEDGSQILERICFSQEGDYQLYERVNPEDLAKKLKIESYEPKGEENASSRMVIEAEDASFSRISSGEDNRIEISHPDRPENIRFSYSTADGQPKDYDDALEPYKSYMEKLIQRILKDEDYDQFTFDFATRGKEIMAELAKVEEASA